MIHLVKLTKFKDNKIIATNRHHQEKKTNILQTHNQSKDERFINLKLSSVTNNGWFLCLRQYSPTAYIFYYPVDIIGFKKKDNSQK